MRRVWQVLVAVLLVGGGLVVAIPSANASPWGPSCSAFQGYAQGNWAQNACIGWDNSGGGRNGLYGGSSVLWGTNFNSSHVIKCQLDMTLVSSYGTTHTVLLNCTQSAQDPTALGYDSPAVFFGPGNGVPGTWYSIHACLEVWTGIYYSSCNQGDHPSSINYYPSYG